MPQYQAWEHEYRKSKLLTLDNKPQGDVVRFVKFLKKQKPPFFITGISVLDLGSGTGRNAYYFAELGAKVMGIEISDTAIQLANSRAKEAGLDIDYLKRDISEPFPADAASVDIILDVTSSNSLDERGRGVYLRECMRVLKPGGFFFLKTLCKDGDQNAKQLLKISPGKEKDTYYMKELGLYERVFTREDLITLYSEAGFKLVSIDKKTSYPSVSGRVYKRNSFISVWTK